MINVTKETELAVPLPPEPAELARLIATVGTAHIEMLANCTYQDRDSAVMLLVTKEPVRMVGELRAAGFRVTAHEVVLVRAAYERQLAAGLSRRLSAAGLGLLYSYVSWTEGQRAYLVFKTTDDDRAVNLLRTETLAYDVAREKTITHHLRPVQGAAA